MPLKILKVSARNLFGFEQIEIPLDGQSAHLTGGNGVGKSSFEQLIEVGFFGATGKRAIKDNRFSGEVAVAFTDGTVNYVVERTVTPEGKSGSFKVKGDGTTLARAKEFIARIARSIQFKPLEFYAAAMSKKLDMLISALPVRLTRKLLFEIANGITAVPEREAVLSGLLAETEVVDGVDWDANNADVIKELVTRLTECRKTALVTLEQAARQADEAMGALDRARRDVAWRKAATDFVESALRYALVNSSKDNLPEGVGLQGSEITYLGQPVDTMSTGEQLSFAVSLAADLLRPGTPEDDTLSVLMADNVECLDTAHRAILEETAREKNIQFITAERTEGALAVNGTVVA